MQLCSKPYSWRLYTEGYQRVAQVTKDMIDDKLAEWKEAGTRIEVMRRGNRVGCACY